MPEYPISKLKKLKYDSPSGYVNVGKYISPFEKVKDGYGFLGVILEDCDSGKLQCNICGKWFSMFNSHLPTHNITSNEYRKRFGLSNSTALRSKEMRLKQSKVMQKLRKQKKFQGKFERNNLFAGNRKNKPKSKETKNKYGICDLQIANKIMKLKEDLKKTPTLTELKDAYGFSFITCIHNRYQSYIKLCKQLDLEPNFSNYYPKYSKQYFIEKALSNEPSTRIFTINERRAFYKYFKSINKLKIEVLAIIKKN